MLHPATRSALLRLQGAALASDCELDRALSDVGVLPPVDLDAIRNVLTKPGTDLTCRRNPHGHTIIEVRWDEQLSALVHPDGRVQLLSTAAA